MQQDIELMRKILFAIEEQYKPGEGTMWGPKIDGYDMLTIAEHCDLLKQKGLINSYMPNRGNDTILGFRIGNLSAQGYDYLEVIRNDEVWEKTKSEIETKKLPRTIEAIAKVAAIFSANFFKELNG